MKVKCPDCGKICFVTTDMYDPSITPHGGMIKLLPEYVSWGMDWLTVRSSGPSVMTCPVCEGMLVFYGKFLVVAESPEEPPKEHPPEPKLAAPAKKKGGRVKILKCPKCGKICKGEAGLSAHMRHCKE
jgi:hypothetical protein